MAAAWLRSAESTFGFGAEWPGLSSAFFTPRSANRSVFTNEFLRAYSIALLNGAQNLFMLPNRRRKTAWFRRGDNRGGRGESDGLNTIDRELKHRAFCECDESLVKSQIQFTEACHLLGTR